MPEQNLDPTINARLEKKTLNLDKHIQGQKLGATLAKTVSDHEKFLRELELIVLEKLKKLFSIDDNTEDTININTLLNNYADYKVQKKLNPDLVNPIGKQNEVKIKILINEFVKIQVNPPIKETLSKSKLQKVYANLKNPSLKNEIFNAFNEEILNLIEEKLQKKIYYRFYLKLEAKLKQIKAKKEAGESYDELKENANKLVGIIDKYDLGILKYDFRELLIFDAKLNELKNEISSDEKKQPTLPIKFKDTEIKIEDLTNQIIPFFNPKANELFTQTQIRNNYNNRYNYAIYPNRTPSTKQLEELTEVTQGFPKSETVDSSTKTSVSYPEEHTKKIRVPGYKRFPGNVAEVGSFLPRSVDPNEEGMKKDEANRGNPKKVRAFTLYSKKKDAVNKRKTYSFYS